MSFSEIKFVLLIAILIYLLIKRSSKRTEINHTNSVEDNREERKEIDKYFEAVAVGKKGNLIIGDEKYHVIKLVKSSINNYLALLHYKPDGYYYFTIIDIESEKIAHEFSLDLCFSSYIFDYIAPNGLGRSIAYPHYDASELFEDLNDGIERKFRELQKLLFLEIDFEKQQVFLFGRIFSYGFLNSNRISYSADFDTFSFDIYDFSGHSVFQKQFINKELKEAIYLNGKLLMLSEKWEKDLEVFDYKTNISTFFNLLNNDEMIDTDEFDYDYLEHLTSIAATNMFGFTAQNPTYGSQGLKIMEISNSNHLILKYSLNDIKFNGSFHQLAFDNNGKQMSTLLYRYPENLNILNFSTDNTKDKEPSTVLETSYSHHNGDTFNIPVYFSDEKLAIIKADCIALFNLKNKQLEKKLNRDLVSPYCILNKAIYFCSDKKLKVYQT